MVRVSSCLLAVAAAGPLSVAAEDGFSFSSEKAASLARGVLKKLIDSVGNAQIEVPVLPSFASSTRAIVKPSDVSTQKLPRSAKDVASTLTAGLGHSQQALKLRNKMTSDNKQQWHLSRQEYVTIFLGIADGFGLALVEACIKDDIAFEQNIQAAVAEFEMQTNDGVKSGLAYLATAFESNLPSAIRDCKGTYDQVEAVLASLASFATPQTFAFHIGKDLLVNGVDIFRKMTTAIEAWKMGSYHTFGMNLGGALRDVLLGSVKSVADGIAFFEGMAEGLGATVDQACMTSANSLSAEMEKIIAALKKGTRESLAEAVMMASWAWEHTWPEVQKQCSSVENEIADILADLKEYDSFEALIEHIGADLVENSTDIYADANGAVDEYNKGDFEDSGKHVGHLIKLVLVGKDASKAKAASQQDIYI
ncbi:unnamed protein product [Amoebophrya sp. A25]|nr:unnamed protein product [Amoebophrya sp. A25]|eukprot:GSA25T00002045001.1